MRCILFALAALVAPAHADTPPKTDAKPDSAPKSVLATVTSSLTSSGEQIRQLAFDGDDKSFFLSDKNPTANDHFTLTLDQPVVVKSITVITGQPDGSNKFDDRGVTDVSADGKTFDPLGPFTAGTYRVELSGKKVQAIRLRTGTDLKTPVAVREIVIQSDPPVATFKYPVEFLIDVSDAPDMQEWADKAAAICVRAYPLINEELQSDGFKPPRVVRLALKNPGPGVPGVAAAGGGRITGNVKFFKDHPNDFGAMVHETVHVIQRYRGRRNNPGWLVEGVADYIRFFKHEPGKIGRLNVDRARYDRSYRVTAAFLAFVTDKYDKQLVRKLNQAMREGNYKEDLFKDYTGKTVQELDEEWRTALRAKQTEPQKK